MIFKIARKPAVDIFLGATILSIQNANLSCTMKLPTRLFLFKVCIYVVYYTKYIIYHSKGTNLHILTCIYFFIGNVKTLIITI